MTLLLQILILSFIFIFIDFIYLNSIKSYFQNQISLVQKDKLTINYLGVFICYILLVFGLYYFIIQKKKTVFDAFLFGIIIYGVFETTNLALFNKWKFTTVFIDTLWGGILFAITTYLFYLL